MSFSVKNLGVSVGKKTLLSNINFSVEPGETVVIMGPNGAGKSTLLKVMANEICFYNGSVLLNGKALGKWHPTDRAKQIGVLPQSSLLSFPFSVIEIVLLGRLPHNSGHKRDHEIAEAAIEKLDISHLANKPYPSLSGGEKQRVHLARVLAQIWETTPIGNRYLLLDEPTSALDAEHQHLTLKLANALAEQGIGVVAILHDLNLAAQYADRIVMMQNGGIAEQGKVAESMTCEKIKKVFSVDVSIMPHPVQDRPVIVSH